jgi:hypothetical protein
VNWNQRPLDRIHCPVLVSTVMNFSWPTEGLSASEEGLCSMEFFFSLGGVRLSPRGTSATVGLLYQPRMIDNDYGAVGGMRIGRGN